MCRTYSRFALALLLAPFALCAQNSGTTANSDLNYRALRDGKLAQSYLAENIVLEREAGTVTLKNGELSFQEPVLGRVAIAVFTGQGHFHLKPALSAESARLRFVTGAPEFDDDFDGAMLFFTDATAEEVRKQAKAGLVSAKNVAEFEKFHSQLRTRVDPPRSFMEYEMFGATIPNLEAQTLSELYNPAQGGSFIALLHAHKHAQLRFLVRPEGAIPSFGPEEVALVNVDPGETQDGVLYMAHTAAEIQAHAFSSNEERRVIAPEHYKMDVRVARNDHLGATAAIRFRALRDGDRLVPFLLLPNLRVSSATLDGAPTGFIQEGAKQDGALWLILPRPTVKDHVYTAGLEYEGNKVIFKEGSGNYTVTARESWYPAVSPFRDRSTFDITFHSPKRLTLVGVGKLVSETKERDDTVAEWKSDDPLPVAGFNYGDFKKKERSDDVTKYTLEAYTTAETPDYLKNYSQSLEVGPHAGVPESGGGMMLSPTAMANNVLVDVLNSVRLFTQWFGPAPFGRLAVTQQPAFAFGQSWPTLVYLPVSAFLDPTQRWQLLGGNTFRFSSEFINVVTAHEVSHQWWGHTVSWASYHDQWLSEGFATFSAGLFLQATETKGDAYQKYWEVARHQVLDKNEFGNRANDVGPLWMGLRLGSFKAQGAYQQLTYYKGAFVMHMLRYLMQDRQTGDKDFIDMMHDFVTTYQFKSASTEDFQHIVEKHMRPDMNLDGNGRMDWFFNEWVFGTEVPSYRMDYSLGDADGGKMLLTMKVSQADVGSGFKMNVPVYADFEGRSIKLGSIPLAGSSSSNEVKVTLPKRPRRVLLNANNDILASAVVQK